MKRAASISPEYSLNNRNIRWQEKGERVTDKILLKQRAQNQIQWYYKRLNTRENLKRM